MNIAVIGSREGFDKDFVYSELDKFFRPLNETDIDTKVISGGARGIDKYVEQWCKDKRKMLSIIRPVNPANKLDYLFRNIEIITKANKIIAFWDGQSRGTKFVIDYAKARGKEIEIHFSSTKN